LNLQHGDIASCTKRVNDTLKALDLQWQYKPALTTGIGFAKGNVWSRAARRKMEKSSTSSNQAGSSEHHEDDTMIEDEPALGFKVHWQSGDDSHVEVAVRWLQGRDSVLFESFCGMLKRQLTVS
jgi:23S rRNA (adenine1618-N6)-methyltransferase